MKEHCTSHYLAEILRERFFDESSGILVIEGSPQQAVRLHFDRGMLAFGEGPGPEETLQHHLEANGLIEPGALRKLAAGAPDSRTLAERLVSGGILDKPALARAINPLIAACTRRAFSWAGSSYEFTPGSPGCPFYDPDVLGTFEALLSGIVSMAHFEPMKEVLLRLPGRLRLGRHPFIPIERLVLKPHHGYILSRADGSMRLEEIRMLLPAGEEDSSLLFLYALAVFGIMEFEPAVGSGFFSLRAVMHEHYGSAEREKQDVAQIRGALERMMKQSPSEMLHVAEGADLESVERGYEEARRSLDKGRFDPRVREQCRRELSLLEGKLAESYMKLKMSRLERSTRSARQEPSLEVVNPEELLVRREMVKTQAQAEVEQNQKLAERYLHKARDYHGEKDFHNCIQFCQLAIKFDAASAPAWALMADALARNPNVRWQKMAEDAFRKACELDPWNAEHRVALGDFYRGQGLDIRARKQYEKALEIVPTHPAALAALKGRRG